MAYRVVVDHIRTLSFAIADGAVLSSDGRSYVLRRVVRYGRHNLALSWDSFPSLCPFFVELMSNTFPE